MQEPESNFQVQDGQKHGALYEEARKLMAEDDDVKPQGDENGEKEESGPKIKMGRIGKKKKSKAKEGESAAKGDENYTKKIKGL